MAMTERATASVTPARGVRLALVDGVPGAAVAMGGQTRIVWSFVIVDEKIIEIEMLMDPARLGQLAVAFEA